MALRFSIVVPNFNSGLHIERALRSLLAQREDGVDLQLILADAGSTDESRDIVERYRTAFQVVIQEPDKGQADGLNKGFRQADGDIRGWLCADDELEPHALRHVEQIFEEHPSVDVVTGRTRQCYPDGTFQVQHADENPWDKITMQNIVGQPSTFWKADLHRAVGELNNGYHICFDWEFWARMARHGARLRTTDKILSNYYFSDTNKSGNAGNQFVEEAYKLIREFGPLGGKVAWAYRFLYYHFDLFGAMDNPPTSSRVRHAFLLVAWPILRTLIGESHISLYNWYFASRQQRRLKWHP